MNSSPLAPTAFVAAFVAAFTLQPDAAKAVEIYGGAGTTGAEIGFSQDLPAGFAARLDFEAFGLNRNFTTSDINYDAKLKSSSVGAYVDYFVVGGFRLTGGALIGDRKLHGMARSANNTVTFNGTTYPVTASDTLDFDAKFPTVTPYLGIGFGHNDANTGVHFYADAGVAYGRPKVTLSPSASLAAKVSATDLAAEQASAQDKANDYRAYPVLKLGLIYRF